jgi:lysophospholipase L1-like esterase
VASDLAPASVLNRAFDGSNYVDVDYWIQRDVINYQPAAVVVYAGDNDLAAPNANPPKDAHRTTPDDVAAQIRQFEKAIHAKLPQTMDLRGLHQAVLPAVGRVAGYEARQRPDQGDVKKQKNIGYIDIATPMFGGADKPPRDLFLEDGLHPTDKLYGRGT